MLRSFPCICSGKHLPQVKEGMLAEIEKIRNEISDASLYDGKTVYYLGKPYRLRLERGEQRDYGCGGYHSAFLPEAVFRCAEGGISGLAEGAGGEEICGNYG